MLCIDTRWRQMLKKNYFYSNFWNVAIKFVLCQIIFGLPEALTPSTRRLAELDRVETVLSEFDSVVTTGKA